MSTRLDETLDTAADRLQTFVQRSRREGGLKAKLGEAFEGDPAFLRKLKPSLIAARARGERPGADGHRSSAAQPVEPEPPRVSPSRKGGGPSPWLVLGAAFAVGVLTARVIDWRSHAHPRL
jgi:hypothetical protein